MSGSRKTKKYSCVKCGEPFEINPPDDLHTTASRVEKECETSVKIEYECKKCGNLNTIYWCRRGRHPDWYA
jgi:DNA-directed RNA polymerase subunit M/transcription elongation factor TFIIS